VPRAIWKGSISFGLVHIPVELHAAEKERELDLSLLDARDHSPVGYTRRNKRTGREVPWEKIVRGYEVKKGRYVVLGDEDLKRANPKATRTIEILDFVDATEIPPFYFEKPYYLASAAEPGKGYALLRATLQRTGRVGIARVVIHTRQHLAAVLPSDDVLVLNLLRFAHELRDASEVEVPGSDLRKLGLRPKEIEMAEQLVLGMVSAWEPERYRDDYREDLLAFIRKKARSGGAEEIERAAEPAEEGGAEVVDLVALLKRSLGDRTRGDPKRRIQRAPAKRAGPAHARRRKRSA
jgi:DNA end-binding protein Ku